MMPEDAWQHWLTAAFLIGRILVKSDESQEYERDFKSDHPSETVRRLDLANASAARRKRCKWISVYHRQRGLKRLSVEKNEQRCIPLRRRCSYLYMQHLHFHRRKRWNFLVLD
jgi:hypothetical protein